MQSQNILIVDDNEGDVRLVREMLSEALGDRVALDWAPTWDDGLSRICERPYDVYLIDYSLGKSTGIELIREAAKYRVEGPFILFTGHNDREIDLSAQEAGAYDYLVKSEISAPILERTIRYVGETFRRKRALVEQADELKKTNALINERSQQYIEIAEDLNSAQVELRQALSRAEKSEKQFRRLAHFDPLTGLANRTLFGERLRDAFEQSQRSGQWYAILMIDLDRFKQVNDTLGHAAGDQLLEEVAKRLRACFRRTDTVARLGGDEFAVVATNLTNEQSVAVTAGKVISSLSAPFTLEQYEATIGASVGITVSTDADSPEELLIHADIALYEAKNAGRGVYRFYDAAAGGDGRSKFLPSVDPVDAMEDQDFSLTYQPKVRIEGGELTGVESLIMPGAASEDELSAPRMPIDGTPRPSGAQVLRRVCAQIKEWQDMGLGPVPVAISLAKIWFSRGAMAYTVRAVAEETGADPSLLEFEITESVLAHDPDLVIPQLNAVRDLGVQLTLDNFGTGYSSLALLKQVPVDKIKIDRTFVTDLLTDERDAAITLSMIQLADHLGTKVVAKGVECEEVLAYLAEHGCDEAQGYFISRPLPPEEFVDWYRKK